MSLFQTGQTIFGKYRVEQQIGAGSFGEVYRVTHLSLNATRALKIMARSLPGVGSQGFTHCRDRFQLEAQLGARLNHPNVVRVYDFLEEGDLLALEMEYLSGGSISKKMQEVRRGNSPLTVTEIVSICSQVAEGLGAIHQLGIVHRDLSPNNILLDDKGQAKIADLGLAYLPGADFSFRDALGSQAGRHPGTPKYMSPEQENTIGHLTPASDVYALGLILFEMLSGKSYKDCKHGTSLSSLGISIPAWINRLITNMLTPEPDRRPPDGCAVSLEFQKHGAAPVSQTASARPPVGPGNRSKNNMVLILAVTVLVGLGLLGVVAAVFAFSGLGETLANQIGGFASETGRVKEFSASSERMSGDFRVAVAEISVIGQPENANLGKELADGVYQRLEQTYAESNLDFSVTIWGPDRVRSVRGATEEERTADAEKLTSEIGADILVYGFVDVSQPVWRVTPQFFVSMENFYQAAEINGPEQMGAVFEVTGAGEMAHRLEFSDRITPRIKILARITVGLAYYSAHNYEKAVEQFQSIESLPEWSAYEGKQTLYMLKGNAAANAKNLTLAEESYLRSLEVDPEYSRALVGLAGTYYLQALQPFNASQKPADTDLALLEKSIQTYQQAASAQHQPPLADIPTKIHFGLGQDYLMRTLAGQDTSFNAAVAELQTVINDYGEGKNPRVRVLAAESHARLGLIYSMTGSTAEAARQYASAAELLYDDPERQALYQKRAKENQTE